MTHALSLDVDHVAHVIDRLALICTGIEGVRHVFKDPPEQVPDGSAYPYMYFLVGGMPASVPGESGGTLVIRRAYVVRVVIAPFSGDNSPTGSVVGERKRLLPHRLLAFFMRNTRLRNAEGAQLAGLVEDVRYRDAGPVPRVGPGGHVYTTVDGLLEVALRYRADSVLDFS